jgi:diadenosine tetraphosphate (Ap4A) HIT family hydrolase
MVMTAMHHYRKTIKKYRERQNLQDCPFCAAATQAKAVKETLHSYIVPNLTQYDLWELHEVTDHLLVIPKRHVKSLQELSDEERLDIMNLAAEYDSQGYSMYARGVDFATRSVEHQHTHLIKASNKRPRLALFLRKPYIVIKL